MRASLKTKKEHAHEDGVWACTWTPDGKLVTGSVDETVRVWELADGSLDEPQHTFSGQYLGVVGVSVDASGQFVATTALDSFIRVWSIVTHQERALIETPPTETWGLAFNPASPNLQLATAGGSSSLLRIYDLGPVHDDPEQPLSMSPSAVLNLPKDRNTEKGSKERSNFLLSVAFSPDGTRLACGAFDGSATVFDVASQKVAMVMKGHHKPIRDLSFSPDGSLLMTACDDMHVNVYEMGSSEPVKVFSGHESWVLSLSPHPSGNYIATGSSDGKAKLWDIRTGLCMHTKSDHSDQIWGVGFDPTGELLATAGDDGAVALYSVVQQ